ncbi:hypothetical protein NE237_005897 [Protea cynaroides]|uniref:Helicase MOV-10-like beta-barrel domain-containing protein n=1 Tax=Protea cynaroides TaxID=273540 RepID=A0A9Q0KL90_9MAGN|nr:hypothetical protein NE237_005897 [Protea cynaroides]
MSWFVGILKRVFGWEENESSDRRNPRYSDHGLSSVNVGVSYPRAPSCFTPTKPPSSINQCQSSSGSPASISKLPTSSSNLSPSSSLLGPQNPAGSFTPTKPPSSINQCQSSSLSPASISKLPTSSSKLSPSSSLLGSQNTAGSFTPTKPLSSINQCQSSSGSPASISKLPTSSSKLSPSSSLLGPQNTAASFTPTKPPSSINQCQSSSGSPASISKLPTSSSKLSPSSSLLGPQNTAASFTPTKPLSSINQCQSSSLSPASISKLPTSSSKLSPSSSLLGPQNTAGSFTPTKPPSSINQCQSSSGSPASISNLPTSSSNLSPSSLLGPQNTAGSFTSTKPPSSINQCQSSSGSPASISKLPTSSSNLSPSSSPLGPQNTAKKTKYVVADKDISSIYVIPDSIKDLIKKDIVPEVLRKPVSPSTYRDYFAALLYAEDFYTEKWSNFCLTNVNLELHNASIYKKSTKSNKLSESDEHDDKMLVAFQIDLIPERRPFLLSRDFVFVRPSGRNVDPFQGILYRVVKSSLVLAEFGDDFYSQYASTLNYDISFSFNRVCLKRCHQAVAAATNSLCQSFLFPGQIDRINNTALSSFFYSHQNLGQDQTSVITQISRLIGPPPFLIEGLVTSAEQLSKTGLVIREAVLKIYRTSPSCRILINAPTNSTCDLLLRSLTKGIPESEMFRANAAFRELDGVPDDILTSCEYKGECFTCPSLLELSNFKVILSTFVSSFRIHNEGINPGHFSHIFLLDASLATEPEALVTLVNLVDENTSVVVTGALRDSSRWVRSDIARRYGLKKSYFQRLLESKPYKNLDRTFVMHLGDNYA